MVADNIAAGRMYSLVGTCASWILALGAGFGPWRRRL